MLDAILAAMTPVEVIATVMGLFSVWLTVRRNIWCWPTGLVMVSLYVWIFGRARLYSDAGLQVVYIFLQLYGFWHWLHGGRDHGELPVSRLTRDGVMAWLATAVLGTLVLGSVAIA